ncbi:MAG: hypothetical protein J6B89_04690 [Bacilli bacterium]|nr:hypothetical protein [Bacilli bacterium]
MDYLNISSYLNGEISILKKKLIEIKERREFYSKTVGNDSILFRKENFEYKYTVKMINKLNELLDILKLVNVINSTDLESKKYKEYTISLCNTLIDLSREKQLDFKSVTVYLKNEIKTLKKEKSECVCFKDRLDCDKKIERNKRLISIVSRCKSMLKCENSEDFIDYLLKLTSYIENLDAEAIKYIRISNFDKNILDKYMMLFNGELYSTLYDNLLRLSYDSLDTASHVANRYLNQYSKLNNYCNGLISVDICIPSCMKEQISEKFDECFIKRSQLSEFIDYLQGLIVQHQNLMDDFDEKFSFNNINNLRERMSVKFIKNTYWNLLYDYREIFSEDFIFEKRQNMEEYLGRYSPKDPYYATSSHRLDRLSIDYQDMRKRAINYLRDYATRFCVLGVSLEDLDFILMSDDANMDIIKERLKEVKEKIAINHRKLQEYYEMIQNVCNNYSKKTSELMMGINSTYDDFFFITHTPIDYHVASAFSNVDDIIDGMASLNQQNIFNSKFGSRVPVKVLKS